MHKKIPMGTNRKVVKKEEQKPQHCFPRALQTFSSVVLMQLAVVESVEVVEQWWQLQW